MPAKTTFHRKFGMLFGEEITFIFSLIEDVTSSSFEHCIA